MRAQDVEEAVERQEVHHHVLAVHVPGTPARRIKAYEEEEDTCVHAVSEGGRSHIYTHVPGTPARRIKAFDQLLVF